MASINTQLRELLDALRFDGGGAGGVRAKVVKGCRIAVDFAEGRIDYGGIKCGDGTTSNFLQAENLVVLECVHRLLEKGYHPGDLILENRWKGGKADILVRDKDGKTMLMIECKTWGAEFDKEQRRMRAGGGQLFSYLQHDRNAKYLCLYASQVAPQAGKNGRDAKAAAQYKNAIVKIEDRAEDIKACRGDETVKLYRDAKTMVDLYEVWKERFNLYFHYNGIFEDDVNAYNIELKPLKKKDLLPFSESDGVFNQFAEILRHNNISDNANAFNRVLSLLLCKMVDEEKGDDEVLHFQVIEGADTPEGIHDRLQKLYHRGMKQYLRERVVYHSDDEINKIIRAYPRQTRLDKITQMFREIKYYTNNEFAFKEVHNKALFEQNGRVLNEVVKMLQNYRFKHTKKQQILGDFFELLLNHGVKQSEGQFFTPVPIVRFILLSIGLERIVANKLAAGEERFLPKILDYACGAGHFLTESIDELQGHLQAMPDRADGNNGGNGNKRQARAINKTLRNYRESTEWAKDYIFGVEKDYRLARTAQIACFINGDGDANIIFGDGLEDHDRLRAAGKFDLIVANPPYSVKAFKNYLRVPPGKYKLFDKLTESAGEIQVLFLERAAQMLAAGGIAGIIMPASILANGGIDEAARRLMLEKFEVKALAEFGSATFSATGTNTVVLFLRRRPDCFAIDRGYIADDLFGGEARPRKRDFIDSKKLLAGFAEQKRGLPLAEYQTLIAKAPSDAVQKSGWFGNYRHGIDKKKAETEEAFLAEVLKQERDKFYVYMLCMGDGCDSQEVVAVNSGTDKEVQKAFLGYSHSKRKGSEGAKRERDAEGKERHGGRMYDEADRQNPRRANSYIRAHLWGDAPVEIDDSLKAHVKRARLVDCLNFDRVPFIADINVKAARAAPRQVFGGKYPAALLKAIPGIVIRKGTSITKAQTQKGDIPVIAGGATPAYYHNRANRKGKTITISASGSAGYVNYYNRDIFASDCITVQTDGENAADTDYIYQCLKAAQEQIYGLARGQIQPHVYVRDVEKFQIPLPPMDVQRKIAEECDAIDRLANTARKESARMQATITAPIPPDDNWDIVRLGEVADIGAGNSAPQNKKLFEDGKYPFCRTADVGRVHLSGDFSEVADRLNDEGIKGLKLHKKSTILFPKSGASVFLNHRVMLSIDSYVSSHLATIYADQTKILPNFLFRLLAAVDARHLSNNSDYPSLRLSQIADIKIALPPLEVQRRIADELDATNRRIAELDAEIDAAQGRKNAVLKKHL